MRHLHCWLGAFALLALSGCASDQQFDAAAASFAKGDLATAHLYAAALEAETPTKQKVLALEGWIALKQGDLNTAAHYLARLQAIDPDYIETVQLAAWVYYSEGNLAAAEKSFHDEKGWAEGHLVRRSFPRYYTQADVVFINNMFADGNTGLGTLALEHGDYAAARMNFVKAAAVPTYPGHDLAANGLAVATLAVPQ